MSFFFSSPIFNIPLHCSCVSFFLLEKPLQTTLHCPLFIVHDRYLCIRTLNLRNLRIETARKDTNVHVHSTCTAALNTFSHLYLLHIRHSVFPSTPVYANHQDELKLEIYLRGYSTLRFIYICTYPLSLFPATESEAHPHDCATPCCQFYYYRSSSPRNSAPSPQTPIPVPSHPRHRSECKFEDSNGSY
jgi:hypothetical protein